MFELFQMWLLVELLGLMCVPLTMAVFHNLPDRGWAFSKTIGVLLLAFCVWLPLMSLRALPFSQLYIAGTLLVLFALSLVGFVRTRYALLAFLRSNKVYIVVVELVFLGMVFLLGWLRSYSPDIRIAEAFMDEGFIAAIMRSSHLPANDMWFAGYSINYYYYAHFTAAVLAKLIGQSASVAFNTGICMFFGLTASNLFGVTCNIVGWARHTRNHVKTMPDAALERPDAVYPPLLGAIPFGSLSMVMGLILGNLAATQEWFKAHGDISQFDWYMPSRVIDRTINEFPAFSFLLSCFHAHVLALAFTILAMGLAFNLFLEPAGKGFSVFGQGWLRLLLTFFVTAMALGGLFAMNGWDYPTYIGLAVLCLVVQQWLAYDRRFHWELVLDIFTTCASLLALSFLLYAPFYLTFISPSQGIGIVRTATDRSQISDELLIYGLFAFVFLSLLVVGVLKRPLFVRTLSATPVDALEELPIVQGAMPEQEEGWVQAGDTDVDADEAAYRTSAPVSEASGATTGGAAIGVVTAAPAQSGRLITARPDWMGFLAPATVVLAFVMLALIVLVVVPNSTTLVLAASISMLAVIVLFYHVQDRALAFTLLLGATAFFLIAICEVFFLRDVFINGSPPLPRMNTVFKFYFQAWALLSVASGVGLFFILESFRPLRITVRIQRWVQYGVEAVWCVGLLLLLLAGAVYPIAGSYTRTNHYLQSSSSLDGFAYMQNQNPGDYAAIRWLNAHVEGDPVIVESIGDDFTSYARVSAFTGLPTVMGWWGHEYQWRVSWLNNPTNANEFNRRGNDVDTIYKDPNPAVVLSVMGYYNAQYLYVGSLEYQKYVGTDLHRFSTFMQVVYSAEGVTIYKVRTAK